MHGSIQEEDIAKRQVELPSRQIHNCHMSIIPGKLVQYSIIADARAKSMIRVKRAAPIPLFHRASEYSVTLSFGRGNFRNFQWRTDWDALL